MYLIHLPLERHIAVINCNAYFKIENLVHGHSLRLNRTVPNGNQKLLLSPDSSSFYIHINGIVTSVTMTIT